MKVIRVTDGGNDQRFAIDNDDGTATICHGTIATGLTPSTDVRDLATLTLLPPVVPGKIVGVGLNYAGHAAEHGLLPPEIPLLFFKPTSAIVGPGAAIHVADPARRTELEAELVVVMGRTASNVSVADALDRVFGYTCGNDVSEREAQKEDKGWPGRSKGYDTFAPIGPCVATDLAGDARIQSAINGRVVQDSRIDDLIFPVASLVSFISSVVTLEPGDLIFTGTPSGVSPIRPGDEVSVTIDGIGTLTNTVDRRHSSAV